MMDDAFQFCRSILSGVSRSFALTIPMLDEDLYRPVLIVYLQDRLLDNFEDEISRQNITLEKRKELMDLVVALFTPTRYDTGEISSLLAEYAPLIPDRSLQRLTVNADLIRTAYDSLEERVRLASYKWLGQMNQGMQKYLTAGINTFADLDEYCYYVAGTVGGFLTDTIIIKHSLDKNRTVKLLENFNDAGLFLQKINLVRDFQRDVRGRDKNFWPLPSLGVTVEELLNPANRRLAMEVLESMLEDIKQHIDGLVSYLEALPADLPGYRRFFCVNNALGLATLEKIENNADLFYGKKIKVNKLELMKILQNPEKVFNEKAGMLKQV